MTRETDAISTTLDLIHSCPAGVVAIGADGKINTVNQIVIDMLGVKRDELVGKSPADLAAEELRALFGEQDLVRVHDSGGQTRIFAHSQAETQAGDTIHYLLDQTELQRLRQENEQLGSQLAELQLSDPATGMHTERAIMFILEPQVSLCRRYDNPLSVMALAIDFGTTTAAELDDKVLKISRLLKDQLRWADLIGRTGTAQMAVILPETSIEAAGLLAEKIHGIVEGLDDVQHAYIGITEWKKQDNAGKLFRRAHEALQQSSQGSQSSTVIL